MSEAPNASQSMISADVEITGTIKTTGSIRIDGRVNGEIHATGDVVLGKTAQIKGNLFVNSVAVAGAVNGNIIAKDKIDLKSSAKLLGDIKAKRLAVEDGVTFIGRSEVNPTGMAVPADGGATPPPAAPGPQPGR